MHFAESYIESALTLKIFAFEPIERQTDPGGLEQYGKIRDPWVTS